ncbi:MAG: DUF5715 family protein [Bacteroidales bacterium]|nr:DUF5715 family protein [Bacteroidales bacterium]
MKYIKYLLLFALLPLLACCSSDEEVVVDDMPPLKYSFEQPEKPNRIVYFNARREFNDLNDTHLAAAERIGIRPLSSRKGIPSASKKLYLIGGAMRFSEPYVVDNLVHSSPFLVKEAAELLHDIGLNFQDSLKSKHLPAYSVIVTSVLRTDADVKSLSRRNINASSRSVHCYGTTVDITYRRFEKHDDEAPDAGEVQLKGVLAEVLRDLRRAGRCYVKYEVKQACFHITAR